MKLPQLDRLGRPGVIALGLLLFCLAFYLSSVAPARAELATLKKELAQLKLAATPSAREGVSRATDPPLPTSAEITGLLKSLAALAASHGVAIDQATFAMRPDAAIRRLEISLPLSASYPALRAYLRDALALTTSASLDEFKVQRQQGGDAVLAAKVRLSYSFADTP